MPKRPDNDAPEVSAPERSTSGRAGRGEGRLADVEDAALTLFAEYGFHGTTMKDIAGALKMRAPSLYSHVASKQALLEMIVVSMHEMADRELRAALASTEDVAEQLRRAVEAHVRFHALHPRHWKISSREVIHLEEPAKSKVRGMRREFEALMIETIERGVERGCFDVASPKMTVYAMLRMSAGVGQWYRPDGEFSHAEIARYYGELVLRMVGHREPH